MLQCSNPLCRALSPSLVSHCQTCQTPLHYRFLLAVCDRNLDVAPGTVVADRYWVWSSDIWLDTQPDTPVTPLEVLPPSLVPYLRLSILPHHMPRPFSVISPEEASLPAPVLLLDGAPIGSRLTAADQVEPLLLPSLASAWERGSALQQVNWLKQIAQLWPHLAQEGVASTLLQPDQLRVDHALLRLSQLVPDDQGGNGVELMHLGEPWKPLAAIAQPEVKAYLNWLAEALINREIQTSEALEAELDQAVRQLAAGLALEVDWVAYTDQGPERHRNEDACYPESQFHQQQLAGHQGSDLPLLLVCDGIGGHEQGNVASQTAIKVLLDQLHPLAQQPQLTPQRVEECIYQALALANDAIADRNNDEHRAARARMGTTVVLALVHFPYVSIAHLGDSRAYRISDRTCYQVTLDDDIASRETRLGYTLYQEALQIPNGGALIQALGISDSTQLYPTVHHLLIDDPAVLLLCSDGLSDYDRVEQLWRHHLSPLVSHQSDLPTTGQALIQQANHLNGHDNVTVGLLRFTPKPSAYSPLPPQALQSQQPSPSVVTPQPVTQQAPPTKAIEAAKATEAPVPAGRRRFPWPILLGGVPLAALAVGVAAWLNQQRQPEAVALNSLTMPLTLVKVQANSLEAMTWAVAEDVAVGSFWQAGNATPTRRPSLLQLGPTPGSTAPSPSSSNPAEPPLALVPTGSILKVVSRQTSVDETIWVRLQVCSIPSGAALDQVPQETDAPVPPGTAEPDLSGRLSAPGQAGWVQEQTLYRAATLLTQPSQSQQGTCSNS